MTVIGLQTETSAWGDISRRRSRVAQQHCGWSPVGSDTLGDWPQNQEGRKRVGELVATAAREKYGMLTDLYFACCLQAAWGRATNDCTSTVLLTAAARSLRTLPLPSRAAAGSSCESPEPSRPPSIPTHNPDRRPGPNSEQHQKTIRGAHFLGCDP